MINLLSPINKKQLRAARRNSTWFRYTLIVVALLITINILLGLTYIFIETQAQSYQARVANNEKETGRQYSDTNKKAGEFRKNLATAKKILDGETDYSTVIISIAKTIPKGCVLDSLNLNAQSFSSPQSFAFRCKTIDRAIALKTSFENNPDSFVEVNFSTVAKQPNSGKYPVAVNLSATIIQPRKGDKEVAS